MVAKQTPRGGVQVKHQREDGFAGHVVELDLAPAQVLPSGERVDLACFGSLKSRGVVVRVLDVHFSSRFAGEDVRLAAAEPDVPPRAGRLWWDFVILETERVQPLEALNLLT